MIINVCMFCIFFSASADLITINVLYNLFVFVQARFKPLVNQVFYFQSFFGELLLLDNVC